MNTSTWLSDTEDGSFPQLKKNIETEIVIVGAGMAGTLSAYLLAREGKKVVLLEKSGIQNSTTSFTTAFITYDIDTDVSDLIKMFGKEKTKKIWQSGAEAIDLIEKIVKEENIDCEFERVSQYVYAENEKEYESLEEESRVAVDIGFTHPLNKDCQFGFITSGAMEIPAQAKFHPLKFLVALKEKAKKYGVEIYQETEVLELTNSSKNGKSIITAKTKQGNVSADFCIISTYKPFNNPKELFAHTGPYVSFVYELEIPKGAIKYATYLDLKNPYHYMRIDKKSDTHDRMIIGGEDHRKEVPMPDEKNFTALLDYVKKIMPELEYRIVQKWSGTLLENIDGLPYIGAYSKKHPHELACTGFSGNGMQFSAIAAKIFTDRITGKNNPYASLYSPYRGVRPYNFIKKVIDYVGEFFGGYMKNLFK